jgi:hypothetical protein
VFSLHGVDRTGRDVLQRTVRREHGAHEWGRQFGALGHSVRLMAPKFVIPYRKTGKNDGNDAAAAMTNRNTSDRRPEHLVKRWCALMTPTNDRGPNAACIGARAHHCPARHSRGHTDGSNAMLGRIVVTWGQFLNDAHFRDLVSHIAIEIQRAMIRS